MTVWMGGNSGTKTQVEELVIRFKTPRPVGLILLTSADSNSPDRLEIALVAGRIRASVRLGDREKVSFKKKYFKLQYLYKYIYFFFFTNFLYI